MATALPRSTRSCEEVGYNLIVSSATTRKRCRSSTIRDSIAALWRASRSVARRAVAVKLAS